MIPEMPTDDEVSAAVSAFSMLAEPTRLKLLWIVAGREADVTTLSSMVGANPSSVSQHLAKLRLAGLVDTRKAGRRVLYRARDKHVRTVIGEALSHAGENGTR